MIFTWLQLDFCVISALSTGTLDKNAVLIQRNVSNLCPCGL